MGIRYRPEIDGLRAIAVLAVVLYHAGIGAAGFVGVDIFFVISGYLITSLLLQERESTGRIDLLAFYARRVRRIVPAATLVIVATLIVAYGVLDPPPSAAIAQSAAASLAFVANVFFQFNTGGYWDAVAEEMPLLHLWSLSVEEQFYLLWPALLLFTRSRKVMLVGAIASFVLAEWWIARQSDAAFFQMPARFWELAIGGLVAASRWRMPAWTSALGVGITLAACIAPPMHFPGIGAAPAVLGAALVCAGGSNRFLASKPMVSVGLISYSLYLWHWPLLAFYRMHAGESMQVRLLLCAVAVLLAIGTYRYVEQPFRRMRMPSGRAVFAGAFASAVLAFGAYSIALRVAPVMPSRTDPSTAAIATRIEHDRLPIDCEYQDGDPMPKCPDPPGARVAIWGDSMALSWRAGLPAATLQYTTHGCGPLIDQGEERCRAFNAQAPAHVRRAQTVYIAALWHQYANFNLVPAFAAMRGVQRVIVIGPSPRMRHSVPRCLRQGVECAIRRSEFDAEARPILATLRQQAAAFPNVEVLDVTDRFCTQFVCPPMQDDVGYYWDTHHITATYAKRVLGAAPR